MVGIETPGYQPLRQRAGAEARAMPILTAIILQGPFGDRHIHLGCVVL